jgi:hypothetical protein
MAGVFKGTEKASLPPETGLFSAPTTGESQYASRQPNIESQP